MLDSFPQTAWTRLIDYLGFYDACQLRKLNRKIKDRIDTDIYYIYKRIEGKQDMNLSRYLKTKFIYPKIDLPKLEVPIHNYLNIWGKSQHLTIHKNERFLFRYKDRIKFYF